jgi:hypothetical protein
MASSDKITLERIHHGVLPKKKNRIHRRGTGREKKSKFGGLSRSCRSVVFSAAENHPRSAGAFIRTRGAANRPPKLADFLFYMVLFRLLLHRRCCQCSWLSPAQTYPYTDVVGQTRPQCLHPHLAQTPHAELP